ncbi:SUEL-type lectin domain-containing protein [Plasmodiophora brassicae]
MPGSPLATPVAPFTALAPHPISNQHALAPPVMHQPFQYPPPTLSSTAGMAPRTGASQRLRPRRVEARDKFNQGAMTTMSTTSESEPEAL